MSRKQAKRARFAASMKRSRQIGAEVMESYRAWLDRIAANRCAFMSRDEAVKAASSRLAQDIDRMVYERALGKAG